MAVGDDDRPPVLRLARINAERDRSPREPHEVAACLRGHVPGLSVDSVVPLGAGTDHTALLLDGEVVARFRHEADADPDDADPEADADLDPDVDPVADAVRRESQLLTLVRSVSTVPVVRFVIPELGCLGYEALPGAPLRGRRARRRPARASAGGRAVPARAGADGCEHAAVLAQRSGDRARSRRRLGRAVRRHRDGCDRLE